jgi:hypothetical protein
MANTTSGTTTFDKSFSIDEIIEEAYDRLGIFTLNGGHMKTARRSLNIMFQEWGNRGLHYWEVGNSIFYISRWSSCLYNIQINSRWYI